jgi:hypothetical protein
VLGAGATALVNQHKHAAISDGNQQSALGLSFSIKLQQVTPPSAFASSDAGTGTNCASVVRARRALLRTNASAAIVTLPNQSTFPA